MFTISLQQEEEVQSLLYKTAQTALTESILHTEPPCCVHLLTIFIRKAGKERDSEDASALTIHRPPTFSQSGQSLTGDLRSVCDVCLSNMRTSLSSSLSLSDAWRLSADQGVTSRGASLLPTGAFVRMWRMKMMMGMSLVQSLDNGWEWESCLCLASTSVECTKINPEYLISLFYKLHSSSLVESVGATALSHNTYCTLTRNNFTITKN